MTEQPPSAEGRTAALCWLTTGPADQVEDDLARAFDRFAEQRVSAEREQPDEWVLVPRSPTTEMLKAAYDDARANDNPLNALDCWDSMIETAPAPPSPSAVVDYTEQAREIVEDVVWLHTKGQGAIERVAAALSTVASEHEAAYLAKLAECEDFRAGFETVERQCRDANRALRQARAEHAALLGRLREPDVREAVIAAMREKDFARDGEYLPDDCYEAFAAAALTKIAEMK